MKRSDWMKYIVSFLITAGIFATVFYVSQVANRKRVSEMLDIQQKITVDLLSSETQFALLKEASCAQDVSSMLTGEISRLSERLNYMEEQFGSTNKDVISLKMNYSLLLIKDYLLLVELSSKCKYHPVVIMYFYGTDCEDCRKENYVLSAIRDKYPDVRVYAFDASLDLSAIRTLLDMYHVPATYPSFVIEGKTYSGFKSVEEVEAMIPELTKRVKEAQAKALADEKKAEAEKAAAKKKKSESVVTETVSETSNATVSQ